MLIWLPTCIGLIEEVHIMKNVFLDQVTFSAYLIRFLSVPYFQEDQIKKSVVTELVTIFALGSQKSLIPRGNVKSWTQVWE